MAAAGVALAIGVPPGAIAGERSDAGIDADDARTQAILAAPGFAPANRGDRDILRPPRPKSHVRSGHAVAGRAGAE